MALDFAPKPEYYISHLPLLDFCLACVQTPTKKSFHVSPHLPHNDVHLLKLGYQSWWEILWEAKHKFFFQLFIAISWLFQSLIRSIMAIVLQLSGKSLQVEEDMMPLIQQPTPALMGKLQGITIKQKTWEGIGLFPRRIAKMLWIWGCT